MWGSCRCSGSANVSPVLSCICSDKLYSPSIDVRLCCCLLVHFDMSSRLVSAHFEFPGICWWKAWLLCSPWKCCWSWDVSLEALCKESKATGRGNRVTSAESPSASVSFTVLCKASSDFTIKTPKNKTKQKNQSADLLLFDTKSSTCPQRLRLREVHRWTGAEEGSDGVPGGRGAGLQTGAPECGYTESVSMRAPSWLWESSPCEVTRVFGCLIVLWVHILGVSITQ